MTWSEVAGFDPIYLNLGGGSDCHPRPEYSRYIAVDIVPRARWAVAHDLSHRVPLPDGVVSRILSEHFLEHVEQSGIPGILRECYRLLRPGGVVRIAVPDYGHPRRRHCLDLGHDPRRRNHLTLTTYPLLRSVIADSPFKASHFHHYWDGDNFIEQPIDYSLGYVRRTPDNDPRNHCRGILQYGGRLARDIGEFVRHGLCTQALHRQTRRYHRLAVTSLVVDLVKESA